MLLKELLPEQKQGLRNKLKNYTEALILDEKDALPLMKESDFLITTYELEDAPQKQLYLPYLPPLGIGGMIKVIEKMARLVKNEDNRSNRSNVVHGW
jgi:nitrogenase molybdenum-iron protein alpha chain